MKPLLPLALVVPVLATAVLLPSGPAARTSSRAPSVAGPVPAAFAGRSAGVPVTPGPLFLRPLGLGPPRGGPVAGVTAPSGRWTWPLAPRPEVRRRFLPPAHAWSPGHRGVDLAAAVGQPVLTAGAGTVTFSGVVAGRGVVTVRHAGGLRTTYEPVDGRAAVGTTVRRGDRLGTLSAAPGHCQPLACLHWGAVSGDTYRDPLALLDPGHPVLLPMR